MQSELFPFALFVYYTVWVVIDWYIQANLNLHANDLHVKMSMSSVFGMSRLRCVVCLYVYMYL